MGATPTPKRDITRLIVSDTGPLLHLQEAGVRDLLAAAGEIHVPTAVNLEMRGFEPAWPPSQSTWIRITCLDPRADVEALSWQQSGLLHYGEAQAIALARQLTADWLLTDDAGARVIAQSLGLEVHGSLGVVLWAAATRRLDRIQADAALDRLAHSSLWVSSSVLLAAKAALHRMTSL